MIQANKKILLFLVILVFTSCSSQKPSHFIYGKWESKTTPKTFLTFDNNNLLKVETVNKSIGHTYKFAYHFIIVDDKTVVINDHNETEYKVKFRIKSQNENEIRLKCSSQPSPEGRIIVDLPTICSYPEFIKSN